MGHVVILMGLYNGAEYLQPQLDSFLAQTHEDWSLIVSDDGSSDAGVEIVRAFAEQHPEHDVQLVKGPQKGFAQNYLSLLRLVPERAEYISFADQDDCWLPEKLARAIGKLKPSAGPALVCGRTMVVDQDLATLHLSPLFTRPPSFANALVQNIGGGNTMVLNRQAYEALLPFSRKAPNIVAHDWWCYLMLEAIGGEAIYDPEPMLQYRQHGGNQIGGNIGTVPKLARIALILKGTFRSWSDGNLAALDAAQEQWTPQVTAQLQRFRTIRNQGVLARSYYAFTMPFYRQGRLSTWALRLAMVLGRI